MWKHQSGWKQLLNSMPFCKEECRDQQAIPGKLFHYPSVSAVWPHTQSKQHSSQAHGVFVSLGKQHLLSQAYFFVFSKTLAVPRTSLEPCTRTATCQAVPACSHSLRIPIPPSPVSWHKLLGAHSLFQCLQQIRSFPSVPCSPHCLWVHLQLAFLDFMGHCQQITLLSLF